MTQPAHHVDYLTGFLLREALDRFLQELILESGPDKKPFSVAVIDIDRFKRFNDKYGHVFGDEILKYVASTLRLSLPGAEHHFFRYGGDEFVIIIIGKTAKESFPLLHHCNYNILHRAFLFESRLYKVTISCGIAGFPRDSDTAEGLIKKADEAMYFSKRHGFNLTTAVDRIGYIRLRNAMALFCSIAAILASLFALLQQPFFKTGIRYIANRATHLKIATKQELATGFVVLKNGSIYEGRILSEDNDKVVISSKLGSGQGILTIPKSKIAKINYNFKSEDKK